MVFFGNHSINSNWSRMQLCVSSPELPLLKTSLPTCSNSIGSLSNPALILRFYSSLSRSFITWHHHISLNWSIPKHLPALSDHLLPSSSLPDLQPNHHGVKSFQPTFAPVTWSVTFKSHLKHTYSTWLTLYQSNHITTLLPILHSTLLYYSHPGSSALPNPTRLERVGVEDTGLRSDTWNEGWTLSTWAGSLQD